jgi:hypothetical protein
VKGTNGAIEPDVAALFKRSDDLRREAEDTDRQVGEEGRAPQGGWRNSSGRRRRGPVATTVVRQINVGFTVAEFVR